MATLILLNDLNSRLAKDLKPIPNEDCLYVYPPTGMVYVRKTFKKDRIPNLKKPTGFTTHNMQKARRAAQDLIIAHKLEHLGHGDGILNRKTGVRVRDVADEILRNYTPTQRPKTQVNHAHCLGRIMDRFGDRDIDSLREMDLKTWVAEERGKPTVWTFRDGTTKERPPRKSFGDYAKHLNLVMTYARKHGHTKSMVRFADPDIGHKNVLQQKRLQEDKTGRKILTSDEREALELKTSRVLSRPEIDRFYEVLTGDTRDQFILAFTCFMRLREALEAPWSEINLETGEWTLPPERVKTGSKTGEGRSFMLSPEALKMLKRRHAENKGRSRFVFPGWSIENPGADKPVNSNKSAWDTAKERAEITGRLRWHDLRHTALTYAILGHESLPPEHKISDNPFMVSKYAGVSLRTIESVYLHAKGKQTAAVALLNQFEPMKK